jgi:phenylalanine-4-hydroxylase
MLTHTDQLTPVDPVIPQGYQPERADWTIDQGWHLYTEEDHNTWRILFERMSFLKTGRTCDLFERGLLELPLDSNHIPDFKVLSERLMPRTGWQIVAVPGLVPDEVFFEHLANRRFPSGCTIRKLDGLDYQEYPDVFHDVFGHVPLLMYPVVADFIQACGAAALQAHKLGQSDLLERISRLYWYTIEVGLVRQDGEIRSFGAAIASSEKEILFSLQSDSPNRLGFDMSRIMRTKYWIYDLQQSYFVLDHLDQLTELSRNNLFAETAVGLLDTHDISVGVVTASDQVLHRGKGSYHQNKQSCAVAA